MSLFRIFIACATFAIGSFALAQDFTPRRPTYAPWGISSSASSLKNIEEWFPKMASAGVTTIRLFPEWRTVEPKKGTWNWDAADRLTKVAAQHKIEINAVLMGSPPGEKAIHAFPMDNLDDWSTYVSNVVGRYKDRVRYWEVWNEGNGGFNDGKHTTADYAKLAIATFDAAKKANPQAFVGLTVASFDAPYLQKTIEAMAKAGKPNSFDYLCIHPYEIADGLADSDGEIPFLWMSRMLRDMLKASAPEKAAIPIWITEVGRRVEPKKVSEQDAARALVKIYTMAIAQNIACTQWFEGQDPVGEDQGFGLISRDGKPRPAYQALETLTTFLTGSPKYLGWVQLGQGGRGYGFVFEGKASPVLIAWMPAGLSEKTLAFEYDVLVTDAASGAARILLAGQALELTDAPVLVSAKQLNLSQHLRANAGKNFPWGGDYSSATVVSCQPGLADGNRGVFPVGRGQSPTVSFADGSTGVVVQGDINHPIRFFVHPSLASLEQREYYIRATVRRLGTGNVGMNLIYEVADSQGKAAYTNRGQWFGATKDAGWQTYTWHVTDAAFSKMWGYDIMLRPEQSIPFVIGKVEVSTKPFQK